MERKSGKDLDGREICLALHLDSVSTRLSWRRQGRLETSWKVVPLGPRSCSSLLTAVPLPFSLPQTSGWGWCPGAPVGEGAVGGRRAQSHSKALSRRRVSYLCLGPRKTLLPLGHCALQFGDKAQISGPAMSSRIPALPVFSKGTGTSHLPPNFPFSSK